MTTQLSRWWVRGLFAGLLAIFLAPDITQGITTLDSVIVVPNPFNVSGRTFGDPKDNIPGFQRIVFWHVPPGAKIRIYTSAGNFVIQLTSVSADGSSYWDGRNEDNQYVVSDVYIYVVEATLGGKTQRKVGKFIVIR